MGKRLTPVALVLLLSLVVLRTVMAADTTTNPYPSDADTNGASPNVTLSWTAGAQAAATKGNDVYFGTSLSAVQSATHASPEWKGAQIAASYACSDLTAGQTYYWRVDAVNPDVAPNVWAGAVWTFTVFNGAGQPAGFTSGYAAWTVNSLTKVNLTDKLPDGAPNPPAAAIKLAQCESAAFQVAVQPAAGRRLDHLRLIISDLTSGGNTIAAANVAWQVIGYVNWNNKSYADILLPVSSFNAAAGNTHSMLVTVTAPPGQAAGAYTGTITVKTDSGLDTTVNVSVTVYGFAIPAASTIGSMHLKTSWCLDDFGTTQQYQDYGDFLLRYRMNPDEIYRNGTPNIAVLEHWYERGMTGFNIHKADSMGPAGEIAAVTKWLAQLAQSKHGAQLRAMSYFYGFDEKSREYCEKNMLPIFTELKKLWPDIPTHNCSHMYMPPWADPVGEMTHLHMDWIDAEQGYYNYADGELLRHTVDPYLPNKGRFQYWAYNAYYSLTKSWPYTRLLGWKAYQQKADGFLYYCVNGWPDYPKPTPIDPTTGPILNYTFAPRHSDALLVYFGATGPMASMRMVSLRDGMQDYEYLWAIGHYDTDGVTRLGKIASVETARELAEQIANGWKATDENPAHLFAAREAIAAWLCQPYVAKYPTPEHRSTDVNTTPTLTWQSDSKKVNSFNVYFGTDRAAVLNATTASPEFKGNQTAAEFKPSGPLAAKTNYYWRIDEVVGAQAYKGYVWSLNCAAK